MVLDLFEEKSQWPGVAFDMLVGNFAASNFRIQRTEAIGKFLECHAKLVAAREACLFTKS